MAENDPMFWQYLRKPSRCQTPDSGRVSRRRMRGRFELSDSEWKRCCTPILTLAISSPANVDRHRSTSPSPKKPGTQIGPYKLLQQIGEGGMGVVYMAEQKEPVKRRVALKIIKPGMDTRQVIARFEAERQALAMMDHPNIAKVLDAGATEVGRPYFVMELVKGLPITEYCDEQHLTPKERLELFVPICQAVQHAHQKGIIHRDLKPTNILVALYDGQAGSQDHRLRCRQGDQPDADRKDDVHAARPDRRDARVHESGAGRAESAGHRYAQRHLLSGRRALRTADGRDSV